MRETLQQLRRKVIMAVVYFAAAFAVAYVAGHLVQGL